MINNFLLIYLSVVGLFAILYILKFVWPKKSENIPENEGKASLKDKE